MLGLETHDSKLPSSVRFNTVCTHLLINRLPGINTLKMMCLTRSCRNVSEIMKPVPVKSASDVFRRVSVCIANTKNGPGQHQRRLLQILDLPVHANCFFKWISAFELRLTVLLSSVNDLGMVAAAAKGTVYIDTDCHDLPKPGVL